MQKSPVYVVILFLFLITANVMSQDDETEALPITGDVNYVVVYGDTLDAIGTYFDVSPVCIAHMNDISLYEWVEVGTSLLISVTCPRYADDPTYLASNTVMIPRDVVRVPTCEGGVPTGPTDTVKNLAHILGVTESALREANNMDEDDTLRMGLCLEIPGVDGSLGAGGGGLSGTFYVLKMRQSLDEVAMELDVSLESILRANNLTRSSRLLAGQTIFIPSDAPAYGQFPVLYISGDSSAGAGGGGDVAGETYILQPRDTMEEIAREYNVSLQALLDANGNPKVRTLQPGTVIIIPADAPPFVEPGAPPSRTFTPTNENK